MNKKTRFLSSFLLLLFAFAATTSFLAGCGSRGAERRDMRQDIRQETRVETRSEARVSDRVEKRHDKRD